MDTGASDFGKMFITQFAEPKKRKSRKRKLYHLFTGIPMKIHKCSTKQAE